MDFITSRDKETSHKLRLDIMVIATTNYADIDLIEYVQKTLRAILVALDVTHN